MNSVLGSMAYRNRSGWLAGLVAVALAGCDSEVLAGYENADLGAATAADAVVWASASTPNVYYRWSGILEWALAEFNAEDGCPTVTEQGDTTTYTGGCTLDHLDTWLGSATVVGELGSGTITFDGFGLSSVDECNGRRMAWQKTYSGTVTMSESGNRQIFSVDTAWENSGFDWESCEVEFVTGKTIYEGTIDSDPGSDRTTWNGSGLLGTSRNGAARISTSNEVIDDDVCEDEALSGTTSIEAGGDTIVITYDGATDCDWDSTVTWTLNDADQGTLEGVACAIAPGGLGGRGGLAFLVPGAALLVMWRRRGFGAAG
jgi:hypothetical protein